MFIARRQVPPVLKSTFKFRILTPKLRQLRKWFFFATDYILVWELIFETFSHGSWFPPWLTYSNERDIQLSWKYPSVRTSIMKIIFPYTRWIMTKLIRLVSFFFLFISKISYTSPILCHVAWSFYLEICRFGQKLHKKVILVLFGQRWTVGNSGWMLL